MPEIILNPEETSTENRILNSADQIGNQFVKLKQQIKADIVM